MLAIWTQVHTPPKSGWSEEDYKKAANDQWLLAKESLGAAFDFWQVFPKLAAVLTSEDNNAQLLHDIETTTDEGVTGSKKQKQIRNLLQVKQEAQKDLEKIQVGSHYYYIMISSKLSVISFGNNICFSHYSRSRRHPRPILPLSWHLELR